MHDEQNQSCQDLNKKKMRYSSCFVELAQVMQIDLKKLEFNDL